MQGLVEVMQHEEHSAQEPHRKGRGKGKGKGKGKTKTKIARQDRPVFNPERHTFDCYCSYCGNFGHGARECRRKAQDLGLDAPPPQARQTGGQYQQQGPVKGKSYRQV